MGILALRVDLATIAVYPSEAVERLEAYQERPWRWELSDESRAANQITRLKGIGCSGNRSMEVQYGVRNVDYVRSVFAHVDFAT